MSPSNASSTTARLHAWSSLRTGCWRLAQKSLNMSYDNGFSLVDSALVRPATPIQSLTVSSTSSTEQAYLSRFEEENI